MKDQMTHAESISVIADQAEEIERLNAQVAMLREALGEYADTGQWMRIGDDPWKLRYNSGYCDGDGFESARLSLEKTESDWIRAHDKQVRDDALEEAAKTCIEFGDLCAEVGKANIGDCFAEEIRYMKGKVMSCGILFNRHKWAKWSDPTNGIIEDRNGYSASFSASQMRICEKCGIAQVRRLPILRSLSELRGGK